MARYRPAVEICVAAASLIVTGHRVRRRHSAIRAMGLKTYAGRPLARCLWQRLQSGKGFSSPHRHMPHLLKLLLDQGVTDLEDLVHQAAVSKPWVFLDRSGQGVLRYEVWNPRAAEQDCTMTITGPPGLNATPAHVSWKASAGRSQAPTINVQWTGAADAANWS